MPGNHVPDTCQRITSIRSGVVIPACLSPWTAEIQWLGFTKPPYGTDYCTNTAGVIFCWTSNTTVFLLHTSGKYMRLEVGMSGELFQIPIILVEVITNSWIKHIWMTLCWLNILIQSGFPDLARPWYRDIKLMRLFISHGFCSQSNHKSLNWCWMYLKAFWLSNLCTGSGNCIEAHLWHNPQPLVLNWTWLQLIQPSNSDWMLWHKALTEASTYLGINN